MGGCTFSNTFFSPSSSSFSSFYNAARLHAAAALQQPHTQEFQKEVKPLFSFPPLSTFYSQCENTSVSEKVIHKTAVPE